MPSEKRARSRFSCAGEMPFSPSNPGICHNRERNVTRYSAAMQRRNTQRATRKLCDAREAFLDAGLVVSSLYRFSFCIVFPVSTVQDAGPCFFFMPKRLHGDGSQRTIV